MTITIQYRGEKITAPDWPGTRMQGSELGREIKGLGSIGYGRCSSNSKAGEGRQPSADTQEGKYAAFVRAWKTTDLGFLADPDASAGETAAKAREYWAALMAKVRGRGVKVIWVMTSSRSTRGDISFEDLVIPLIQNGVLFAVRGAIYNPAEEHDRHVMHQNYVNDIGATIPGKDGASGGKDDALADGRAIGPVPYGLTRDKNSRPVMDVPDEVQPEGQPATDTPAEVVREIFRRLAARDNGTAIGLDFERRQILIPGAVRRLRKAVADPTQKSIQRPYQWLGSTVRGIAANPIYIGMRRSVRLTEDVPANVEPLIAEDLFYEVQRVLKESGKTRQRWSPRDTMLSSAVFCGVCGGPLGSSGTAETIAGRAGQRGRMYGCRVRGHVYIGEDDLDEYVSDRIIRWLTDPRMKEQVTACREDQQAEVRKAEAEADRLQRKIDELDALLADTAADFNEVKVQARIAVLTRQKDEAGEAVERARMPVDKEIAALMGTGAGTEWAALSNARRRKIIPRIARIALFPVPAGQPRRWAGPDIAARVGWDWLQRNPVTGEIAGVPVSRRRPPPYVPADERRAGEVAAWLAAQDGPRTVYQIAEGLGEHVVNLWRALDVLLEDGRVVKEHGTPNRNNRWFYALAVTV